MNGTESPGGRERHERDVLRYWLGVEPDLTDITVIVRRGDTVLRTVLLEPPVTPTASSSAPPSPSPGA